VIYRNSRFVIVSTGAHNWISQIQVVAVLYLFTHSQTPTLMKYTSPTFVQHALPISFSLKSWLQYENKITNYETPYHEIFFFYHFAFPLSSIRSFQHPLLKQSQNTFLPYREIDTLSTEQYMYALLYISFFIYLLGGKAEDSKLNRSKHSWNEKNVRKSF
jgi:hypothetical protein